MGCTEVKRATICTQLQEDSAPRRGEKTIRARRILIVEDHVAFSQALTYVFKQEPDLEVVGQASSVAELQNHDISGAYDIAIVDLALPDGNGLELIGKLKRANPHLFVLVLTASLEPAVYARAKELGAREVLSKGTRLSKIVAAVKRMDNKEGASVPQSP